MRRLLTVLAATTLLGALTACGDDGDESAGGEDDAQATGSGESEGCEPLEGTEDVIVSVSRPILAFAPMLLAMENGAFEEAGLNVTIEPLSAPEALAPLSQGRIDASLTSYGAGYFNATQTGVDLRWVMPSYDANPESQEGYWVRTDLVGTGEEMDLEALEGETFGSPTAGTGAGGLVLAEALEPAGIGLGDVTLNQLSGADALIALENGAVAGTWLSDPIWTQAQENPDLRFFAGYGPGINGSGLVVGPRFLDRPEVLQTFIRVVSETIAEHLGPGFFEDDEVVDHLVTALDTTPEDLRQGLELGYDPELSLEGAPEFLDELQALMLDQGVLEYDEPIDTETLVDESFTEAALTCG